MNDRDQRPAFELPSEIVDAHELSDTRKIDLLEDWRLDLIERQRATEENMSSATNEPGEIAETLRQVNDALTALRKAISGAEK